MPAAVKAETRETAAGTRAALYLRVSTGRQAEADLSIPDQRRQALAFCAARGWDVAVEFVEPGASGMDDRRPELQRLLDIATAGAAPFDVVVVHSFSRFARCFTTLDSESAARCCNSARLPTTSKWSHFSHTQIGKARPQKRFFEIIQSPMLASQSFSRALPGDW